jgi:hypothetical protein
MVRVQGSKDSRSRGRKQESGKVRKRGSGKENMVIGKLQSSVIARRTISDTVISLFPVICEIASRVYPARAEARNDCTKYILY